MVGRSSASLASQLARIEAQARLAARSRTDGAQTRAGAHLQASSARLIQYRPERPAKPSRRKKKQPRALSKLVPSSRRRKEVKITLAMKQAMDVEKRVGLKTFRKTNRSTFKKLQDLAHANEDVQVGSWAEICAARYLIGWTFVQKMQAKLNRAGTKSKSYHFNLHMTPGTFFNAFSIAGDDLSLSDVQKSKTHRKVTVLMEGTEAIARWNALFGLPTDESTPSVINYPVRGGNRARVKLIRAIYCSTTLNCSVSFETQLEVCETRVL
jgi:hypothetical protein